MSLIAYVNGAYILQNNAKISITDRGYQFADAAYEVVLFINQVGCDTDLHLDRLDRTLKALRINFSMTRKALEINMQTLLQKNHIKTGMVYIQISRGVAPRNHPFPNPAVKPVLVMTAKHLSMDSLEVNKSKRLNLKLVRDYRWGRCDLKTVGLLPNILSMQQAIDEGCDDALFFDDQGITEGTSWNFWIVNSQGDLQTRQLDNQILHGITRKTILKIAEENQMKIIEKPILLQDLETAKEAFATSATKIAMPIGCIDNIRFSQDTPITHKLFDGYLKMFNPMM